MKHECKTCHATSIARDPEDHIDLCLRRQKFARNGMLGYSGIARSDWMTLFQ